VAKQRGKTMHLSGLVRPWRPPAKLCVQEGI
jgi:hypothetical protein